MSTPEHIEVVCAVIRHHHRVLSARRALDDEQGGLWELPGGTVGPNETPRGALARELWEELGVAVDVGARIGATSHAYPGRVIELTAFDCRVVDGVPHPAEHEELRWVSAAEAARLNWAPADIPLLPLVFEEG